MPFKKYFISLYFFFMTVIDAKPLKVNLQTPCALLMNADTGAVLYEKQIHIKCYPASLTKIATALYVLEKKSDCLDEEVFVTESSLRTELSHVRQLKDVPSYVLEAKGSNMGLKKGEILSARTLLYGLLLSSGNDAANVLAEWTSGSIEQFMKELNEFLKQNGIYHTHFTNPHGLHHFDHWTTVHDLALITKLAFQYPLFKEIVKTAQYIRPQTNKQVSSYLTQTNRLIRPGAYFYPKAIGVKTGYTSQAGYTLVGAAAHEGRLLIAVLVNCVDTQQRFREAVKLFEAAFSEQTVHRVLFAKENDTFSCLIRGAKEPLQAILKENLILQYYPSEEPSYLAQIEWSHSSLAIRKGDQVGYIKLIDRKENILQQLPIFSVKEVKRKWWTYIDIFQIKISYWIAILFFIGIGGTILYFSKKSYKIF